MTFKTFYLHAHHGAKKLSNSHPRGFTALISANPDDPRTVKMQVTFCSPKDQFNKKEGRKFAALAHTETINKRQVPRMLAALSQVANLQFHSYDEHWFYVYKYML